MLRIALGKNRDKGGLKLPLLTVQKYLLYWYKRTEVGLPRSAPGKSGRSSSTFADWYKSTCSTGTKVLTLYTFAAQRTREIGQELKKMKHHFVDRFGSLDEVCSFSILVPVKPYTRVSISVPGKQVLLYQEAEVALLVK